MRFEATRDTLLSCLPKPAETFSEDRTWRHRNTWLLIVRDVSTTLSRRRKRCRIIIIRTDRQNYRSGEIRKAQAITVITQKQFLQKWIDSYFGWQVFNNGSRRCLGNSIVVDSFITLTNKAKQRWQKMKNLWEVPQKWKIKKF